jgi:hypothetical protein
LKTVSLLLSKRGNSGIPCRHVTRRGEISTACLKAAILDELELGKTQAEGLIYSALEAG